MTRTLPLLLALLLPLAAVPAAADAARRSGVDTSAQVRLTLDGRDLTARLVSPRGGAVFTHRSPDDLGQRTLRLRAACGTSFREDAGRASFAVAAGRWPRDGRSARFRFRRDLSADARWCLLEARDGGDVAFVSFARAEPRRRVAGGSDHAGRAWTLAAWQGDRLQPCLALRAHGDRQERCFDELADVDAALDFEVERSGCRESAFLYGVAPPETTRIELTRSGGERESLAPLAPPPGSALRARLFVAEMWRGTTITSVEAYDAAGRDLGAQVQLIRLCE